MSLLRKLLGLVGLQPKAASGYRSVRVAFRDGRAPTHGSGDYHAKHDRLHLLGMSREFYRDNPIYRGMIRKAAENIVGSGFQLQARTSKKDWNTEAERIWREFWKRPEIRETVDGRGVERLVARELLLMGDVGVVKTNRGKIQVIEAEQIAGPSLQDDGIKRDKAGAPEAFYVAPYGLGGQVQAAAAQPIAAQDFLFMVDPERPTSSRGIPPAQAAFGNLYRINDVCDSEAVAWNLLSRMAISVNREAGPDLAYGESAEDDTKTAASGDVAGRVTMFEQAMIFHGKPGETVQGIDRNIPGKDFTASLTTFLRLLGMPLGLPLEFIMLDWTKSNYSQCRAILEQARETFEGWQGLLVAFFHGPLYEWVIASAIAEGLLVPNDEWDNYEFITPSFPWIDQLKEAQGYGLMLDRGLTTHARVCKSRKEDRDEVVAQLRKETEEAINIAKDIEASTGVKVPWEPFCGRMPSPAAPAVPPEDEDKDAEEKPAGEGSEEDASAAAASGGSLKVGEHTKVVRDAQGRVSEVLKTAYFRKPKPPVKVVERAVVLPEDAQLPSIEKKGVVA
jgi:capsid protein